MYTKLGNLITALERCGLYLGGASTINDPDTLALVVEVAAKNYGAGKRNGRQRRARADFPLEGPTPPENGFQTGGYTGFE